MKECYSQIRRNCIIKMGKKVKMGNKVSFPIKAGGSDKKKPVWRTGLKRNQTRSEKKWRVFEAIIRRR